MSWFGCFPHTLNLVVKDGLMEENCLRVLTMVRALASHFKRSSKASNRLQEVQHSLKMPEHKMIRDCETRWSSTFFMLERYLEQHSAVQVVCNEHEVTLPFPTRGEIIDLQMITKILKPFADATTCMSSETNVTLSSVMIHFLV